MERRFSRLMATWLALSCACIAAMAPRLGLVIGWREVLRVAAPGLILAAVAAYCALRRIDQPGLQQNTRLLLWVGFLPGCTITLLQLAARSRAPLADATLAGIDTRLGLPTEPLRQWLSGWPFAQVLLMLVYQAATPILVMALGLPMLLRQREQSMRFVVAMTLSLSCLALCLALLPAVGPWTVYHFTPTAEQAAVGESLHRLKVAGPIRLNAQVQAIVAFPSFHVVIAVLAAYSLWGFRRLRVWLVLFAVATCVATISTGWHYSVDVLGGIVIGVVSAVAANVLLPLESRVAEEEPSGVPAAASAR